MPLQILSFKDNLLAAKVESYEQVLKGIDDFEEIKVTDEYPSSVQSIAKVSLQMMMFCDTFMKYMELIVMET